VKEKVYELWHISRTALATQSTTRYDRLQYIKRELIARYPELVKNYTPKRLWLEISEITFPAQ
jgi:hypothetical protein